MGIAPAGNATSQVLLADDNPHVLQMYCFAIEKLASRRGLKVGVATAADGRAALELLDRQPFDLLITDLYMPVLDGFELIERVRTDVRHAAMRVLAITAGDPDDAARSGADRVLRKPVQFELLADAISALLPGGAAVPA